MIILDFLTIDYERLVSVIKNMSDVEFVSECRSFLSSYFAQMDSPGSIHIVVEYFDFMWDFFREEVMRRYLENFESMI